MPQGRIEAVIERLHSLYPRLIDLSLERLERLLGELGNPERSLPPVLHVAGTNGKGSTCAFLRAMGEAAGMRVHVATSPHLVRFNERIRLAGTLIDDEALNAALDRVEGAGKRAGVEATVFETTTAAAFLAMSEVPAELALIEVGLGGSLDATNVIDRPLLSVITPVDLDHAEFLGTDRAKIGGEKAGILKPGARGLIARQAEDVMAVIEARAARTHSPLTVMGMDFDAWTERGGMAFQDQTRFLDLPAPGLTGPHQIDNAGLAVAVALELDLPEAAIAEGLKGARWPARMQRLTTGPYGEAAKGGEAELWLDGGHNPHAAQALAQTLSERQARVPRPLALIVGMLANKDAGGFFEALKGSDAAVFTVPFEGSCAEPVALAAVARGHGLAATPTGSVREALDLALRLGAGRLVICGSLYLAGEVMGAARETWPT